MESAETLKKRIEKLKIKIKESDEKLNLAKMALMKGELANAEDYVERVVLSLTTIKS